MKQIYPSNALILAPLSGFTDLPYRRSARRHGCRYAFTEMIDVAALAHNDNATLDMLRRGEDETFLGVQLVGSDPEWIVKAVKIINNYDFDVLDFNLGCPVAKVVKKNAGAQLGRQIDLAAARLKLICEHAKFPVTAKIRIPEWDNYDLTAELCEKLSDSGANCITIHGRVREAFYSGPVNYEFIRRVRAANLVQIVGNGGVMGVDTCREMRRKSGASEIMLARGAMGNPWIFEMLWRDLRGEDFAAPTLGEFLEEIQRHLSEMAAFYGETRGLTIGRKVLLDYLRGRGFGGEAKNRAVHVNTLADLQNFLDFLRRIMNEHPIFTGNDRGLRIS